MLQYGIREYLKNKNLQGLTRAQNERLQNELLNEQVKSRQLDKDLKDAQGILIELQTREIKTKRVWAAIGAVAGAALTLLIELIKSKISS